MSSFTFVFTGERNYTVNYKRASYNRITTTLIKCVWRR